MAKPFIKPVITPREAAAYAAPGKSLMVGGFNYGGAPYTIIEALCDSGVKDIDLICVDTSYFQTKVPGPVGVARLVTNGQLRSLVASHIGLNKKTQELYTSGKLKIELIPMGTLPSNILPRVARGSAAYLRQPAWGPVYEEGRETVELDGRRYIL